MATTIENPLSSLRAGGQIKRTRASLVGGIIVAAGVFVLWVLIAEKLGYAATRAPVLTGGAVLGALVGAWVRLADL